MSTLVVRMDCEAGRRDEVVRHLIEDVVVWAQEQPGFVNGSWHLSDDGARGLGFVEFATPGAAERAAAGPRGYRDPDAAFRIASVDVYEQVAAAPIGDAS